MKQNIELNICITDIPEGAKYTAKNGKTYVKARLIEKKEVGQYGDTHFIAIAQTKEQREAKAVTVYIGNAKPIEYTPKQPTAHEIENAVTIGGGSDIDNLPF